MTIDKDGLASLLERVREAKGPDRELDYAISRFADGELARHSSLHLPYTASIDASLALVERLLPGSMKRVFDNPDDGSTRAEIVSDLIYGKGDHDTWPLAILVALLRALKEVR
jgi:hypothetical protein